MSFQLVDAADSLPPLPPDTNVLIEQPIQNRPDLQSLKCKEEEAQEFRKAQHEQLFPTINALGVVGETPVGSSEYFITNWYGLWVETLAFPYSMDFDLRRKPQRQRCKLRQRVSRLGRFVSRSHGMFELRV